MRWICLSFACQSWMRLLSSSITLYPSKPAISGAAGLCCSKASIRSGAHWAAVISPQDTVIFTFIGSWSTFFSLCSSFLVACTGLWEQAVFWGHWLPPSTVCCQISGFSHATGKALGEAIVLHRLVDQFSPQTESIISQSTDWICVKFVTLH